MERERVLRHRVAGVVANVGYDDAALTAGSEVDVVGTGRRDGHEAQPGRGCQRFARQLDLVDHHRVGVGDAFGDMFGRRMAEQLYFMREGGWSQRGLR